MGFGGHIVDLSRDVEKSLLGFLPHQHEQTRQSVMLVPFQPFNPPVEIRCGLDVTRIKTDTPRPLINIGILAADGQHGLLGRGQYQVPQELFTSAQAMLASAQPS